MMVTVASAAESQHAYSVLQCVAVCCSVLTFFALYCSVPRSHGTHTIESYQHVVQSIVLNCVAVYCRRIVLHCVV